MLTVLMALLFSACARPGREAVPVTLPGVTPPAPGSVLYELAPRESEIEIRVYRDGPLAAMGHNHVILATGIQGRFWVADSPEGSRGELSFPVAGLEVDEPARRAAAGEDFPGQLDQAAVDGTRANMLGARVLDAENYGELRLILTGGTGPWDSLQVDASVLVRDLESVIRVPARLEKSRCSVTVAGAVQLPQTQLGLEPFSVMMGALAVRDELDLSFSLMARRPDC